MASSDEKNYGPRVVGLMLGACVGSYIEYGVTKDELTELVCDMYDGIVAQIGEQGLELGFGDFADANFETRIDRLRSIVANGQLPATRDAACWYLISQFEDEIERIKEGM